jgi:hypothetical protein
MFFCTLWKWRGDGDRNCYFLSAGAVVIGCGSKNRREACLNSPEHRSELAASEVSQADEEKWHMIRVGGRRQVTNVGQ